VGFFKYVLIGDFYGIVPIWREKCSCFRLAG